MNYWVTTHWPPRENNPNMVAEGVWVPDGREEAGKDLRKGDLVAVYQSLSGRTEIFKRADGSEYRVRNIRGKGGVIALCEAQEPLYALKESSPSHYANGTTIWWRWYSSLRVISKSGFLSRQKLNEILGYSPNNPLRGFGDKKSGLKKIPKEQFLEIRKAFRAGLPSPTRKPARVKIPHDPPSGIESKEHLLLKEYVAAHPKEVLNEDDAIHKFTEYPFCTGDQADVVLEDAYGRVIGVEVEVSVDMQDLAGVLQAIKYRYMLEVEQKRVMGDSRALLVAYEVSQDVKRLCSEYDVEVAEVTKEVVFNWANNRRKFNA